MVYQENGICIEYNLRETTSRKGSDKSKEKFVVDGSVVIFRYWLSILITRLMVCVKSGFSCNLSGE